MNVIEFSTIDNPESWHLDDDTVIQFKSAGDACLAAELFTELQEEVQVLRDELNKRTDERDNTERKLSVALNFVPSDGVPHLFTAGWDAGFQEAMMPDDNPEQDRCTAAYLNMVGSGMIQP